MENVESWDESYILKRIEAGWEENLYVEFKSSESIVNKDEEAKKKLSKHVSAFANSDGGIIVFGICEAENASNGGQNPGIAGEIDYGFDPREVSKEWIEDVLTSRIKPKIEGLKIHSIRVHRGRRILYVVEIPSGTTAHQAGDFRYYKRHNFKAEPMEDYEIRDIMNRKKHPLLEIGFEISRHSIDSVGISIFLTNNSEVRAKDYALQLEFFKEITVQPFFMSGFQYVPTADNPDHVCLMFQSSQSTPIIFPGQKSCIASSLVLKLPSFVYDLENRPDALIIAYPDKSVIYYKLFVEDAAPFAGSFSFKEKLRELEFIWEGLSVEERDRQYRRMKRMII